MVIQIATDINPISSLYYDMIEIIQSSIVKFQSRAIPQESLEVRKYVDRYFDALLKRDTFFTYKDYTEQEFRDIGIYDQTLIQKYQHNLDLVEKQDRQYLLENRRRQIVLSYNEPNEYYRLLNGIPKKEDTDCFYVPEEVSKQYGIPLDLPIHKIEDVMGEYYISIVESLGIIDQLIEAHPEKEYLTHLGSRRVSIYKARTAKNFDLLYVSGKVSSTVKNKFEVIYYQCREYMVSVVYNNYMSFMIDNYDEFIGLVTMTMALEQLCMRSIENAMHREFFDPYAIQLLYKSYNFPFIERLNPDIQKSLAHNMNLLIQNKAHNQVFTTVANLLGFFNIHIYEHVLVKEHNMDRMGLPIFQTKTEVDPDTGELVTRYDLEAMFNVYFQKIELGTIDRLNAFDEDFLKEDYMERVEGDPFWWLDRDTFEEVWEEEYNYAETKYLSLSISYRTMEMIFETVILMRMLLDSEPGIEPILLELPKILPDIKVRLYDVIVFLIVLLCKKHDLNGEIITNPSGILGILDQLDSIRNYSESQCIECLSFDFKFFQTETYKEEKDILFQYFTEDEKEQFLRYISILDIQSYQGEERKIEAINQMYRNITYLYRFLGEKMEETTDINEYTALRRFYQATFYAKELEKEVDRVSYKDGTYLTFYDVLKQCNRALYDFAESMDISMISYYADHAIAKLEEIIPNLKHLYAGYDLDSPVEEALIRMIKYLKSYTTDFVGLDVIHIFDDKTKNMIKLIDSYKSKKYVTLNTRLKELNLIDELTKAEIEVSLTDRIRLIDRMDDSKSVVHLEDDMNLNDEYHTIKKIQYLKEKIPLIDEMTKIRLLSHKNDRFSFRETIHWYETNPYNKEETP